MSELRYSLHGLLASREFATGILFAAIGLGFAYFGADYGIGTARRMGPGYFPVVIGGALCLIGIGIIVRAVVARMPLERAPKLYMRPLLFLTASVLTFGLTINRFGLIVACISTVFVAAAASQTTRLKETAAVAVALGAFCALVFVEFLGLPMRLWRW